jgi:DNA polymerase-3 subunit gamma/tau
MTYIVTARKWRPKRFEEVVGQEHITTTLKNALKNNRIAHAYLFTGPRGVGKTTTARILAKTLNCLSPVDAEPCNECEMCTSIQNFQSLDIIEIDGASNRGIDEIRTLRESVRYAPTRGKYKIYIIDEVHMLTKESFNAFLKTLEEPPGHTVFVFATTDVHKVPLTIISRCQRFDFRRIQLTEIKALLSKIAEAEKITIDDKALTTISKKADGALRDAESFFDQVVAFCGNNVDSETVSKILNLIDEELYFRISDAVLKKDFKAVFDITNEIYNNGWDFTDFMDGLVEHFRNILTVVLTEKTSLIETAEIFRTRYIAYLGSFTEPDLLRLLNFLNKSQQQLRFAQNPKLKLEISLSHLIGLENTSTLSELISSIENNRVESSNRVHDAGRTDNYGAEKKILNRPAQVNPNKPIHDTASPKATKIEPVQASAGTIISSPDFDAIIQKWEGFIADISSERGLILGPFMRSTKPLSLDGQRLNLQIGNPDGKEIFEHHKDYINKKAFDFFGKRIDLVIKDEVLSPSKSMESNSFKSSKPKKSKTKNGDPFAETIMNELGGKELV